MGGPERTTTVLVTGATGFIGGAIAKRLAATPGYQVIGTGRRENPSLPNYRALDISSLVQCEKALEGVDIIVHCAGMAGAWGPRDAYFRANVLGTENLLTAARHGTPSRFVFLSSPSIYFEYRDQLNLGEDQLPETFSNAYAETKYLAERAALQAHEPGFQTLALRPRGVLGPGDTNWIPRVLSLYDRGFLLRTGARDVLADFTSIDNLLDAIELSIHADADAAGQTFNITNGTPERLWDVIDLVLSTSGRPAKAKRVPRTLALGAARLSAAYHSWRNTKEEPSLLPIKIGVASYSMTLSIEKAKRVLGYHPRVSTREAIEAYFECPD